MHEAYEEFWEDFSEVELGNIVYMGNRFLCDLNNSIDYPFKFKEESS